jgi:flagellar M-ring protein FliF
MASIDRPSTGVPVEQLRALAERLWRPIAAQRPAVRWGLAAAVILVLGAASYWGAGNLSASGLRYLASTKRFSSDDVIKIGRALEKQRIAYRIDDLRRVEVTADQFDQAAEVFAKLDLGPRSFEDIRNPADSASLFDGEREREQKEKLRLERMLERLISEQQGVLSAIVSVNRPRAPMFTRNSAKPSAFVYVETEGGHALPSRSVQAILALLDGYVPGLAPESITVMDRRGMRYLDPGNPSLGDHSRNRAREEEITEQILEKLDWIKGVRVQVQVLSLQAAELIAKSGGAGTSAAKGAGSGDIQASSGGAHIGSIGERPISSQPVIVANRPITIEIAGEQSPAQSPVEAPSARLAAAKSSSARRVSESHNERGRVLVSVPRSFYINMAIPIDQGEPSREDLRAMAERTERQVRTSVALLLPDGDLWKVDVGTIADDVALSRPAILLGTADSRHRFLEWGMVGALALGLAVLAVAGSWVRLARRPARVPELSTRSQRFHAGSSLQPSPSERVRELIQRNPEAAASVLQRWVGQGGRSA